MLPKVGLRLQGLSMAAFSMKYVARLWREEGPFDLIDAHYVYPDGYAALRIAKRLNVPVVVSARGTDINLYPDIEGIGVRIRETLEGANEVVGVSQALVERMVQLGASREHCWMIPNGVDLERFAHNSESQSQPNGRLLLAVGNLVPEKGFDQLVRAFADVARNQEDLTLAIIGEGPQRGFLEELAGSLEVKSRVSLLGAIPHEEIHKHYHPAALFCLSSQREGCPNVVLEALASGVPVVSTPVGGVPEMVQDGTNGLLVADFSVAELASGIRRGLAGSWDRSVIRSTVSNRSWGTVADRLQKVFLSACGGDAALHPD